MDVNSITSNDVGAILATLGVEAARATVVAEVVKVCPPCFTTTSFISKIYAAHPRQPFPNPYLNLHPDPEHDPEHEPEPDPDPDPAPGPRPGPGLGP